MKITERIRNYFQKKSPFSITTDILFYLLILALILPFSRKFVATGLNKLVMHRPAVISESERTALEPADYQWILSDMDIQPVPLSRFSGKTIFLNFWATWCPPCRAEMPNIQQLYDEFGDRVEFVLISIEDTLTLRTYMDRYGYDLPVYLMVTNPPEKLQSQTIPTTFLIGPTGEILVRKTGAARWDGRFFREYLSSMLDSIR